MLILCVATSFLFIVCLSLLDSSSLSHVVVCTLSLEVLVEAPELTLCFHSPVTISIKSPSLIPHLHLLLLPPLSILTENTITNLNIKVKNSLNNFEVIKVNRQGHSHTIFFFQNLGFKSHHGLN